MGKQRAALMLAVLLVLLIVGWWNLPAVHKPKPTHESTAQASAPANSATVPLPLVVHHTTLKGANIYSGSLGSCQTISSGISAIGQNPAHIMLLLTATPQIGSCRAVASSTDDFSLSFQSMDTKAPVINGVVLNGTAVPYTLIEGK